MNTKTHRAVHAEMGAGDTEGRRRLLDAWASSRSSFWGFFYTTLLAFHWEALYLLLAADSFDNSREALGDAAARIGDDIWGSLLCALLVGGLAAPALHVVLAKIEQVRDDLVDVITKRALSNRIDELTNQNRGLLENLNQWMDGYKDLEGDLQRLGRIHALPGEFEVGSFVIALNNMLSRRLSERGRIGYVVGRSREKTLFVMEPGTVIHESHVQDEQWVDAEGRPQGSTYEGQEDAIAGWRRFDESHMVLCLNGMPTPPHQQS